MISTARNVGVGVAVVLLPAIPLLLVLPVPPVVVVSMFGSSYWNVAVDAMTLPVTPNAKRPSRSVLDRSGGILYRTSVVPSKKEWDVIYQEVMHAVPFLQSESKSSIAQHRLGIALSPQSSPTVQLLRDPNSSISKYINRIASHGGDCSYVLAPDVPVEIRSYETINAHMNWHVDDVLYQPIPQIEIILTILNTSNCQTMWKIDGTVHAIETDPNSLLCLRAGVTSHCVTHLQYGKRIILKFAYIPRGNVTTFLNHHHHHHLDQVTTTTKRIANHQFQSINNKKYNKNKKMTKNTSTRI